MSKVGRVMLLVVSLLVTQVLVVLPPTSAQMPLVLASLSGPSDPVNYGEPFAVTVSMILTGDTPAYCAAVALYPPVGFQVSPDSIAVGEVDVGGSVQFTVTSVAVSHNASGYFGGEVTYSDNLNCEGTLYTSSIPEILVTEATQYLVTFVISSGAGPIKWVSLNLTDSLGNVVGTLTGVPSCPTCTFNMTVYLPSGEFLVSASVIIVTSSGELVGAGITAFSSSQGVVAIDMEPVGD